MCTDRSNMDGIRRVLVRQSAAVPGAWHAVIDAAAAPRLPQQAKAAGLRAQTLYAGALGAALEDVAPHLVALRFSDAFAAPLLRGLVGNACILLRSSAPFEELRTHFRRFLMVKDTAGKKYRFRFYDPRILRAFLPACTGAEVASFFGPVARFYAPARDGKAVLAFANESTRARVTRLSVA